VQEALAQPAVQEPARNDGHAVGEHHPHGGPDPHTGPVVVLANAMVASMVLSPSSASTNDEMTAKITYRGSGTAATSSSPPPRLSRQVHAANSRNAMAAANAIGRAGRVSPTKWPIVTDSPCTRNDAMATPESTAHQRWRRAYVMVISCDLSPSSARNTTPRLTRAAVSTRKPFDVSSGAPGTHGTFGRFVEGLAHRLARFAGRA
jgi:hypothetical protein